MVLIFFYTTITPKKEVYLLYNTIDIIIQTNQDLTGNFKNKCHMDNQIVFNWIFKDLN